MRPAPTFIYVIKLRVDLGFAVRQSRSEFVNIRKLVDLARARVSAREMNFIENADECSLFTDHVRYDFVYQAFDTNNYLWNSAYAQINFKG